MARRLYSSPSWLGAVAALSLLVSVARAQQPAGSGEADPAQVRQPAPPGAALASELARLSAAPVAAQPLPPVPDVSLEAAARTMVGVDRAYGLMSAALLSASLAAGLPVVLQGDRGGSVGEARRFGAGVDTLAFAGGYLVGTIASFVRMARAKRSTDHVPGWLHQAQRQDLWWVRRIVWPVLIASFVGAGAAMYGLADDPVIQGVGLSVAAHSAIGLTLLVGVGTKLGKRLRPFYPLAEAPAR